MIRGRKKLIVTALLSCLLTALASLLLYHFDNKYTAPGDQSYHGVLDFTGEKTFLIDGWRYYPNQLLTPDSPELLHVEKYVYIGQYAGFEHDTPDGSPHGSASYAMTITVPEEGLYALYLPEIFSACRVYVDGKLLLELGEAAPDSYRPATANRLISFPARDSMELLIAVTDFSHLYSGIVYPPAFGEAQAVTAMQDLILAIQLVVCTIALAVMVYSLVVGVLGRAYADSLLLSLLCLFFIGYTCHPITHTFFEEYYPLYALENVSFCLMLFLSCLLVLRYSGVKHRIGRILSLLCGLVCLSAVLMPYLQTLGSLDIMLGYSRLISAYHYICAAGVTAAVVYGIRKGSHSSLVLLCGAMALDTALIMDRLLPAFEPVYSGWFPELASAVLVFSIGVYISAQIAAAYKDSSILRERAAGMERLAVLQNSHYRLLDAEINKTMTARHDIRHHLLTIQGLVHEGQTDKLRDYVTEWGVNAVSDQPILYSRNKLINMICYHYAYIARGKRVDISFHIAVPEAVGVSDVDLCAILSNLLENAVNATARLACDRRVVFSMEQKGDTLLIRVDNTCPPDAPPPAEGHGYGLRSIQAAAEKYGGMCDFSKKDGRFTSLIRLLG